MTNKEYHTYSQSVQDPPLSEQFRARARGKLAQGDHKNAEYWFAAARIAKRIERNQPVGRRSRSRKGGQ